MEFYRYSVQYVCPKCSRPMQVSAPLESGGSLSKLNFDFLNEREICYDCKTPRKIVNVMLYGKHIDIK